MEKLLARNKYLLPIYAIVAAFSTYFCMYAFRKPFAVGLYDGLALWGVDYKIVLVVAQVLGYTLSKFLGIKVIAEMPAHKRGRAIVLFIGLAWLSLFLFGLIPYPYNFVFMFFNGLPLGLIWGLVFSYLEGRKHTEALAAGLSASFIVASGMVKSVGKFLMTQANISEFWMPFYTGLVFAAPLLFFVWMLSKLPAPDRADKASRMERVPMNKAQRKAFYGKYALGLTSLIVIYIFLTIFRDFRDNFAADIWHGLGYAGDYKIFFVSELPVAFGVLLALGATMFIKNNKTAFWLNHVIIGVGMLCIGLGSFAFVVNAIQPLTWMVLMGLGLYLGYVPYNSMLFERLIAVGRQKGNAGYLIYVADSFGYLGSVLILLYKNFWFKELSYGEFFVASAYFIALISLVCLFVSWRFFLRHFAKSSDKAA